MSFVRVAGAIVVLGLALSGCRQVKLAAPQDAGPICEEGERLVAGICRFVCERDGHCPEGERCNLFVGMCEPKPPPPDAGPIVTPCTTGADRCTADSKSLETCGTDNTWTVKEVCPTPNGFCKNEKCLACVAGTAACIAPDDGGSSTSVSVCKDDGSGLRTVVCSGSGTCTQGECRECTPGSTRCSPDSKSLQTCTKGADETLTWKWANTGDNLDGTCITQVCELNATTTMPQCKPPACIPGATSCLNVTTQQLCGPTGSFSPVSCTVFPDGGVDLAGECQNGVCVHECDQAVAAKSYFGCEYWTSIQDNNVDKFFKGGVTSGQGLVSQLSSFAFVVTNRSVEPTSVVVTRFYAGAVQTVATVTVPGKNDAATKGLMTIYVPWQSVGPDSNAVGIASTGQARYAYKITSTRPITVYQFNPLDAVKYTKTCTATAGTQDCACNDIAPIDPFICSILGDPNAGVCANAPTGGKRCSYNTFSNDASLLLPAHDLGTSHVAISQEHTYFTTNSSNNGPIAGDSNGYLTIVGTQNGTTVTVKSSAATAPGPGITAMTKGESRNFTLNAYDVLQLATANLGAGNNIECANNPFGGANKICRVDNDLTGTVITSTSPVAVFGGASCTTRPYDRVACDHIEEQIFPFITWGKTFVAQRSAPLRLVNNTFAYKAPDHWKIVASCSSTAPGTPCPNGTTITFSTPPAAADVLPPNRCMAGTSLSANNCRLAGAAYMEFKSSANFTLTANFPAALVQMFPGQGSTVGLGTDPAQGDPSMVLLPPAEQWRASYTVLAAPGIRDNYLGLSIDTSKVMSIEVDGVAVPLNTFTAIANSPFSVKNHAVTVGTHTINVVPKPGITPVPGAGVTVFGYDSYVSYGYTGGLDLTTIVSGINPGG